MSTEGMMGASQPELERIRDERNRAFIKSVFNRRDFDWLGKRFPLLRQSLLRDGVLWISWSKSSSKIKTDLNENIIREIGLKNGLVDVKVCSIDEFWSRLKFVYGLKDRV